MSSMVCHGLQSCLEPRLVEPQALGLKLVAPKQQHFLRPLRWLERHQVSDSDSDKEDCNNEKNTKDSNSNSNITTNDNSKSINSTDDFVGFSFAQALTNTSQSLSKDVKEEKVYVHPLVKRSSSKLSEKSLKLCTENLGCETGVNISESINMSSFSSQSKGNKSPIRESLKLRQDLEHKKMNYGSLPPPLTSISGSNCLHIKPHREGGRLVMKAVVGPSSNTCFEADRRDGRLRLRFPKNYNSPCFDSEISNNNNKEDEDEEQEQEELEELNEEIDGMNESGGGEREMEKFQKPSRCKEGGQGNKGMLIWEPLWVATS